MSTQRSNHHLHRHQLAQTPLPKGSSLPLRRLSSDLDSPYSRSNSPAPAFSTPLTSPSSTTTDWAIEQSNSTPSNYEIPLRTLYTNNVLALSNQTSSKPPSSSSSNKPPSPFSTQFSPVTESHSTTTQVAREHFRSCLMAQQSYIQSQPNGSLPPSFITSFVRRVFTEDLCLVDFTQALTGMDYLKALDDRRKRELSAALRRLNIDTSMADKDRQELISKNPAIWEWVASIEDKSKKAEALYTQVYIGLRRWVSFSHLF